MEQLSQNYTTELLKICLRNRRVLDCILPHMEESYFPSKEQATIWRSIKVGYLSSNSIPTIGNISEKYKSDDDILEEIVQIKQSDFPDQEQILVQFEDFIKTCMFSQAYDQLPDLFNAGKKEACFLLMKKVSQEINEFSIKERYYTRVYKNFEKRNLKRISDKEEGMLVEQKIPFGIDKLDEISKGGCDKGDVFCVNAQSGVGKSKMLRHISLTASRRGFRGLHISAEGSLKENMESFDTAIVGQRLFDVQQGNLSAEILGKVKSLIKGIDRRKGEVFVECYEQFDTAHLADIRNLILNVEKVHGKLDFITLDYLELFDPGDGKKYPNTSDGERKRRMAVVNRLKNIAMEFNIAVFTATQASTVDPELLNDPKFVMTRYNISEFKGLIKPLSYFVTLNQTKDEYINGVMRIYLDKVRKYKGGQIVKIFQRYDRERFYDRRRTLNELV